MDDLSTWILLFGVVSAAAAAHVLLKVGMDQVGEIGVSQVTAPRDLIASLFSAPALLAAGPLYVASFIGWAVVLSRFRLSVAYPALALTYVLIPLAAWLILSEPISRQHWAGIAVVAIGVALVVRSGLP